MKTTINAFIEPFPITEILNFTFRDVANTFVATPSSPRPPGSIIHISDLGAETLEAMCDEFKRSVFERAGVSVPVYPQAVDRVEVNVLQSYMPEIIAALDDGSHVSLLRDIKRATKWVDAEPKGVSAKKYQSPKDDDDIVGVR